MADNYLERQYEEYQAQKKAKEQVRKAKWKRKLQEYKEKMQREGKKP